MPAPQRRRLADGILAVLEVWPEVRRTLSAGDLAWLESAGGRDEATRYAAAFRERYGDEAIVRIQEQIERARREGADSRLDFAKQVEAALRPGREFSTTQFDIDMPELTAMAASIADEDLAEKGRERDFHVTVCFGLHTDSPEEVAAVVAQCRPVRIRLGQTSIFSNEKYDVVKVDVEPTSGLIDLHQEIGDLPCSDTHPTYRPHITLGYTRPGCGEKYVGRDDVAGKTVFCDTLIFSSKSRQRTAIPLGS